MIDSFVDSERGEANDAQADIQQAALEFYSFASENSITSEQLTRIRKSTQDIVKHIHSKDSNKFACRSLFLIK